GLTSSPASSCTSVAWLRCRAGADDGLLRRTVALFRIWRPERSGTVLAVPVLLCTAGDWGDLSRPREYRGRGNAASRPVPELRHDLSHRSSVHRRRAAVTRYRPLGLVVAVEFRAAGRPVAARLELLCFGAGGKRVRRRPARHLEAGSGGRKARPFLAGEQRRATDAGAHGKPAQRQRHGLLRVFPARRAADAPILPRRSVRLRP